MNKPNNFDNTQRMGAPLQPGPYVCKIIAIEETFSRNERPMVKIALDILEGPEAGRFFQQFNQNDSADRKWPCVMYQLTEDKDGNCSRGFKTFIDLLEEDNQGFAVEWGPNFCSSIKGKRIGINFRSEEWEWDGRSGWKTKPAAVVSIKDMQEGKVRVLDPKPLENKQNSAPMPTGRPDSMETIDEEVPF